ncbi:MAG TPA: CHAT domain-containing protein [Pyrinomonadaceae bacterium]|jgi:hypothetical protein
MVTREISKHEPIFKNPLGFRFPDALTAGRLALIGLALLVVSLSGYFYFRSAARTGQAVSREMNASEVLRQTLGTETTEPLRLDEQTERDEEGQRVGDGRIVVEWPERMARGWTQRIRVAFVPPEGARQRDIVPGHAAYVAATIIDANGLAVRSFETPSETGDFELLSDARREWTFDVAAIDSGRSEAACTLALYVTLRERGTFKALPLQNRLVEFKSPGILLYDKALTREQTILGSTVTGLAGLAFLGTGLFRGRRGVRQFFTDLSELSRSEFSLKMGATDLPDEDSSEIKRRHSRVVGFRPAGGRFKAWMLKGLEKEAEGASRPKERKILCHFAAEMDEEVEVGVETTLEVSVSRDKIEISASHVGETASARVDPRKRLLIQVVSKENFEIKGEESFRLMPPVDGKTRKFSFKLSATGGEAGEVWVMVFQGQSRLAKLELKPRIVRKREKAARKISRRRSAPEAPPPEQPLFTLFVVESVNNGVLTLQYILPTTEFELPNPGFKKTLPDFSPEKLVAHIYGQIEHYWIANSDKQGSAFAAELRAYGVALFKTLFPTKLQQVLWQHRDEIENIVVISTEPYIPWELVHLKNPDDDGMPSEAMFMAQMGLTRWIDGGDEEERGAGWPPPKSVKIRRGRVRYVVPDYPDPEYKLPEAEQEIKFLTEEFGAKPITPKPDPVRKALENPGTFDLLHFDCHGDVEQEKITQGALMLEGRKEVVKLADQEAIGYVREHLSIVVAAQFSRLATKDNRPMIVLNACGSGREGRKISGIGGFAPAFIRKGASVFVGSLWAVGDTPGRVFTKTFYRELKRGAKLYEAANEARRAARDDESRVGASTWLAYTVYGHPHLTVEYQDDKK